MFEIILLNNGKYGIRNRWTNNIIENQRRTKLRQFRTVKGAARYIRKMNRRLEKIVGKVTKY